MEFYNIYFKNRKINNDPLDNNQLQEVLEHKFIYKKNKYISNPYEKIPTKQLNIVRCVKI